MYVAAPNYIHVQDLMVIVYENGSLVREYTFDEVRERAELPLVKLRRKQQKVCVGIICTVPCLLPQLVIH